MAYVFIDALHGGYDIGNEYNGRYEKDDNLDLSLAIGETLLHNGVNVGYSRASDVYDSPKRRLRMAEENEADLFVMIHREQSGTANTKTGIKAAAYYGSSLNEELTKTLCSAITKSGFSCTETEVLDIIESKGLKMPAVVLMLGYINSDKDNELIDNHFNEVISAAANAIYRLIYDEDIIDNDHEGIVYPINDLK